MRWLALAALLPLSAQAATVAPAAGTYGVTAIYTAVTPVGGADCPAVGSGFSGPFTYFGPAKPALMYVASLADGASVQKIGFSKTPAAGVTSWTGSAAISDSSGSGAASVSFSAALSFFDANSFTGIFKWNQKNAAGGGCDETISMAFIRI